MVRFRAFGDVNCAAHCEVILFIAGLDSIPEAAAFPLPGALCAPPLCHPFLPMAAAMCAAIGAGPRLDGIPATGGSAAAPRAVPPTGSQLVQAVWALRCSHAMHAMRRQCRAAASPEVRSEGCWGREQALLSALDMLSTAPSQPPSLLIQPPVNCGFLEAGNQPWSTVSRSAADCTATAAAAAGRTSGRCRSACGATAGHQCLGEHGCGPRFRFEPGNGNCVQSL